MVSANVTAATGATAGSRLRSLTGPPRASIRQALTETYVSRSGRVNLCRVSDTIRYAPASTGHVAATELGPGGGGEDHDVRRRREQAGADPGELHRIAQQVGEGGPPVRQQVGVHPRQLRDLVGD